MRSCSPKIVPLIIAPDEDRKRGLSLGANAYIAKPIQTTDLLNVVNEILSRKGA